MKVLVNDPVMRQRVAELRAQVQNNEVEWVLHRGQGDALLSHLAEASVLVGPGITAEMARVADRLQLVQLTGAGTGGVDFGALTPRVTVANTYHHGRSVAEFTLMAMIALSRRLLAADTSLRAGQWRSVRHDPSLPLPETLEGQTVGIIGFGNIGRRVARLARCLSMDVWAIKREVNEQLAAEYGLAFLGTASDLPRLLQGADFVVVATPLTEDTRGMLDTQALSLMKPTAFLINVARGAIVDEDALYEALATGKLAGAALDTWYHYPAGDGYARPSTKPFHELDNVIMTPHTSAETEQTMARRARDVAENVRRLAEGKPLQNVVYP